MATQEPGGAVAIFKALSFGDISQLLGESEGVFLRSVDNPTETTRDLFSMFQKNPSFQTMGYTVNSKPVTYITYFDYKQPDVMAIGPMYVAEEYRGRGFGKRQVEEIIDVAYKEGRTAIYTKTWGSNVSSNRIFKGLGFGVQKVKENDRVNGDSTVGYWLDLNYDLHFREE